MSESINWQELTPTQRDRLVAEKVMEVTNFLCTGKLSYDGNNALYRHHYYICQECRVRLTVTDGYRDACGVPKEHVRFTPAYSTSMDAAWQVVQRFTVGVYLEHIPGRDCCCKITGIIGEPSYGIAKNPAEAICIAALEAVGLEIVGG